MIEKGKKRFIMQRKIRVKELWVSIFTDSYWFGRSKGRSNLPRWPILKTVSELVVSFTPIFFPPMCSWSDKVSPYYSFVGRSPTNVQRWPQDRYFPFSSLVLHLSEVWKCEIALLSFLIPSSTLLRSAEVWNSLTKLGQCHTFPLVTNPLSFFT